MSSAEHEHVLHLACTPRSCRLAADRRTAGAPSRAGCSLATGTPTWSSSGLLAQLLGVAGEPDARRPPSCRRGWRDRARPSRTARSAARRCRPRAISRIVGISRWTTTGASPSESSSMITYRGCGHERLRQHDHLLLAARERPSRVAQALLELGEQLERARAPGLRLRAGQRVGRDPDVVLDGQLAEAAAGPRGRSRARPAGSAPAARRRSLAPSITTDPPSGFSTPPTARTRLDLPAPLGPSSAVTSPAGNVERRPRARPCAPPRCDGESR